MLILCLLINCICSVGLCSVELFAELLSIGVLCCWFMNIKSNAAGFLK